MPTKSQTVRIDLHAEAHRVAGDPLVPVPGADYSINGFVTGVEEVTSTEYRPGWRQLISNGLNATTDRAGSKGCVAAYEKGAILIDVVNKPELFWLSGGNMREVAEGQFFWLSPQSLSGYLLDDDVTARNQSLKNLYAHLASVETSFKGMVFTGELRESLRMIRSPASALRRGVGDYLLSLRKRVPRRASRRRKRKIVADTWLEYAYGWSPLIGDLDQAIKAFYLSKAAHPIFQMVRGKGWTETVNSAGQVSFLPGGYSIGTYAELIAKEKIVVNHYGIYQSRGNGISDNHHYGWRPAEFIPTLWELIPYSFLVDYFTNIGDIISSWSYRFIDLNFLSRLIWQEVSLETSNPKLYNNFFGDMVAGQPKTDGFYTYTPNGHPGSARVSKQKFHRVSSVELSVPSLELEVPGMKSTKWVNIAALATSLTSTRTHVNHKGSLRDFV